jgi:hypothetical protein
MSDFDSDGEGIFSDVRFLFLNPHRTFRTISIDAKQIDLSEVVSVAEQTEKKREEEKPTNKNAAVIEVFGSDSDEFSDVSNFLSCIVPLRFLTFFFLRAVRR